MEIWLRLIEDLRKPPCVLNVWAHVNEPLVRYVKLQVVHALGMPGTFSPPSRLSDPDMHHGTCVTHVPWCMPRSLTSGFLWSWWWGKRTQHSRCMHNPQFYISGKRSIAQENVYWIVICEIMIQSVHYKAYIYSITVAWTTVYEVNHL